MKRGFVYITTNIHKSILYIGVTSNPEGRLTKHKAGSYKGFTKKYNAHFLVYMEEFGTIMEAIEFEKKLKKWKRDWKIALIEKNNPDWLDLSSGKSFGPHLNDEPE